MLICGCYENHESYYNIKSAINNLSFVKVIMNLLLHLMFLNMFLDMSA